MAAESSAWAGKVVVVGRRFVVVALGSEALAAGNVVEGWAFVGGRGVVEELGRTIGKGGDELLLATAAPAKSMERTATAAAKENSAIKGLAARRRFPMQLSWSAVRRHVK